MGLAIRSMVKTLATGYDGGRVCVPGEELDLGGCPRVKHGVPLLEPDHHLPLLCCCECGVHELVLSSVCVAGELAGDVQLDVFRDNM